MVVIFVKSPATISIMSVTGIELISYCLPGSEKELDERAPIRGRARYSSLAKLRICDKSRILMRLGEVASEPPSDLVDRYVGCNRGEGGDAAITTEGSPVNGKPD